MVSLDDVAAAAGVGKGTVFRRFGDKAGLAAALLDERERALQQAMLCGPPPLGPGAPPAQRAVAFVRAYLDYVLGAPELVRMSETASPGARYRLGAFRLWRRHLTVLLVEAGETPEQAEVLGHALLAPLAAESLLAALDTGIEREPLITGLLRLTDRVVSRAGEHTVPDGES